MSKGAAYGRMISVSLKSFESNDSCMPLSGKAAILTCCPTTGSSRLLTYKVKARRILCRFLCPLYKDSEAFHQMPILLSCKSHWAFCPITKIGQHQYQDCIVAFPAAMTTENTEGDWKKGLRLAFMIEGIRQMVLHCLVTLSAAQRFYFEHSGAKALQTSNLHLTLNLAGGLQVVLHVSLLHRSKRLLFRRDISMMQRCRSPPKVAIQHPSNCNQ